MPQIETAGSGSGGKPNPRHSTCVQVLLDLMKASTGQTERTQGLLQELYEHLSADSEWADAADKIFASHTYPPGAITYSKRPTMHQNRTIYTLSPAARQVLTALIDAVTARTRLVRFRRDDMASLLSLSNKTVSRAIAELLEAGCIREEQPSRRHDPAVYEINPALVWIGGGSPQEGDFAISAEAKARFRAEVPYSTRRVVEQNRVICEIYGTEKEPSTSAKADGSDNDDTSSTAYDSPISVAPSSGDEAEIPASLEEVWAFQEDDDA